MFCKNCGTELQDSSVRFCPSCGTPTDGTVTKAEPAPQIFVVNGNAPMIYENADIKQRYGFLSIFVTGILLYLAFVLGSIIVIKCGVAIWLISIALSILIIVFIIRSIKRKTPDGEAKKTVFHFIIRAIIIVEAYVFVVASYVFIFGFLFDAKRVAIWVSTPGDKDYTLFLDGLKVSVTRAIDYERSTPNNTRYYFYDNDGVYYRPRSK